MEQSVIKLNTNEATTGSPFDVERLMDYKYADAKTDGRKLFIGGEEQAKYDYVGELEAQKNSDDVIYFNGRITGEETRNSVGRFIDLKNPDTELATMTVKEVRNGVEGVYVNNVLWDALPRNKVYAGGYLAEVDPLAKKIVFHTLNGDSSGKNSQVIVNNIPWDTKFESIQTATSYNGVPYAVGDGKLVIQDKEWMYQQTKDKEKNKSYDSIKSAKVNKDGKVTAVLSSVRSEGTRREYILTGDTDGAKTEWKNNLWNIKKSAIDDETGRVAVFGQTEYEKKNTALIIDDVPYPLADNPEKLDRLAFEDGAVVIVYTNIHGEHVAEKIKPKENAKEVAESNEANKANEDAFSKLRDYMLQANLSPAQVLEQFQKNDALENKTNEATKKSEAAEIKINEMELKHQGVIEKKDASIKNYAEQIEKLEKDLTSLEILIKKGNSALTGGIKFSTPDHIAMQQSVTNMQKEIITLKHEQSKNEA